MVPTECSNRRKPSCRDKGRSGVEERAWWGCSPNLDHASCQQDKHQAPTLLHVHPLSLQDAVRPSHSFPDAGGKHHQGDCSNGHVLFLTLNLALAYKVTTDFLLEEPWRTESRIRYAYPTITVRPKSHCATDILLSFALGRLWEEEKPSATVGVAAQL
jgi:hypothetical protein